MLTKISDFGKDVYHSTVGRIYDLTYKSQSVYEDVIVDRMNQMGINFSDLNAYLAKNVEGNTRRFPEVLKKRRVLNELSDAVATFFRNPALKDISYEERRERFMRVLTMSVADAYRARMRLPKELR